ncbi:UNVERIFIED_CONTAM: hypothetical protein K2H54_032750 [Gekko kuhli]
MAASGNYIAWKTQDASLNIRHKEQSKSLLKEDGLAHYSKNRVTPGKSSCIDIHSTLQRKIKKKIKREL